LPPIVTKCAHPKKPTQCAAKSKRESSADAERDKPAATDHFLKRDCSLIYRGCAGRPAKQTVENHDPNPTNRK